MTLYSVFMDFNEFFKDVKLVSGLLVENVQHNLTNMHRNENHFKPILF